MVTLWKEETGNNDLFTHADCDYATFLDSSIKLNARGDYTLQTYLLFLARILCMHTMAMTITKIKIASPKTPPPTAAPITTRFAWLGSPVVATPAEVGMVSVMVGVEHSRAPSEFPTAVLQLAITASLLPWTRTEARPSSTHSVICASSLSQSSSRFPLSCALNMTSKLFDVQSNSSRVMWFSGSEHWQRSLSVETTPLLMSDSFSSVWSN